MNPDKNQLQVAKIFSYPFSTPKMKTPSSKPKAAPLAVLLLWALIPLVPVSVCADQPVRAQATALRVPDGTIVVDGRDDDWQRTGEALQRCKSISTDPKLLTFVNPDRGVYLGPDDNSCEVWLAADSANLYLLANVRDDLLFNDSICPDIFAGDDFEIYLDANPPEQQFAKTKNENVRKFVFVPAYILRGDDKGSIWQPDTNPGVTLASRLRPWGYTIEAKIPKALFPNWKTNPDQETIGFDVQVNDADSPGLDGPHTSMKFARFLLSPAAHFASPAALGALKIEPQPVTLTPAAEADTKKLRPEEVIDQVKTATDENAEKTAQLILDNISDDHAAEITAAALTAKPRLVHKAGLLVLAKRPQLAAPIEALQAALEPNARAYGEFGNAELVSYGLVALAERHKLPAKQWFGFYSRVADPRIRLTFLWCLGINGDRESIPNLTKLLYDGNLRVRIKAAMALGQLGDPTAISALEEMVKNDPHHYARNEAERAIQQIKEHAKP